LEIESQSQNNEILSQESGWKVVLQELKQQINSNIRKLQELLQDNPDFSIQNQIIFRTSSFIRKMPNY